MTIYNENIINETAAPENLPVIHIKSTKGWAALQLMELWRYRELLYFLTWRDLKVRYKQTLLGAAWAVIQPFFTMLVFSIFFGRLAKLPSDGVPYPIFTYTALVPWTFFSYGLSQGSNSLINNTNLLKKIYFPRLAMPIATVMSGVVDFAIAFVVLIAMMFYYGMAPTAHMLWLPLLLLLAFITALGVALWLSSMNVQFRDIKYAIPFLTQFWLFATPIAYSSSMLDEPFRTLYAINPMVGVVEGFRWAMLGTRTAPLLMIAISYAVAVILLVSGAFYFRRMEKTFADIA